MMNTIEFPQAPQSVRSEMDDTELTMLAMEIMKDADFTELSTQCNVDPSDSFMEKLGSRHTVALLPEMSGDSHTFDNLIRSTLSAQCSSFTDTEEGDEQEIVFVDYPRHSSRAHRANQLPPPVDRLPLDGQTNSDVSASMDKVTIVSGLSTNDSLRHETLPPIPMTPQRSLSNHNKHNKKKKKTKHLNATNVHLQAQQQANKASPTALQTSHAPNNHERTAPNASKSHRHSNTVTCTLAAGLSNKHSNHKRLSNGGNKKRGVKRYSKRQKQQTGAHEHALSMLQSPASPKQIVIKCSSHDTDGGVEADTQTPSLPATPPSARNQFNINTALRSSVMAPNAPPNSMRHSASTNLSAEHTAARSPYLSAKSMMKSPHTPPPKHSTRTSSAAPSPHNTVGNGSPLCLSPNSVHLSPVYSTKPQEVSPDPPSIDEHEMHAVSAIDTTPNIMPIAGKRARRNTGSSAHSVARSAKESSHASDRQSNGKPVSAQSHTKSVDHKPVSKQSKQSKPRQHKKSKYQSDALYLVNSGSSSGAQLMMEKLAKLDMQCIDDDDSKQHKLTFDSKHEPISNLDENCKAKRKSNPTLKAKHKDKKLLCQCGQKLSKIKHQNEDDDVFCSLCGTECALDAYIYHCEQEENAVHPDGYDLCCKCGKKLKKKLSRYRDRERAHGVKNGVGGNKKKRDRKCASDQLYRIRDQYVCTQLDESLPTALHFEMNDDVVDDDHGDLDMQPSGHRRTRLHRRTSSQSMMTRLGSMDTEDDQKECRLRMINSKSHTHDSYDLGLRPNKRSKYRSKNSTANSSGNNLMSPSMGHAPKLSIEWNTEEFAFVPSPRARFRSDRKEKLMPSSPSNSADSLASPRGRVHAYGNKLLPSSPSNSSDSVDFPSAAPSSPREPVPYFVKRAPVPTIASAQYRSYGCLPNAHQHKLDAQLQSRSNVVLHGHPMHRKSPTTKTETTDDNNSSKKTLEFDYLTDLHMNRIRTSGQAYTDQQHQKNTQTVSSIISINGQNQFECNHSTPPRRKVAFTPSSIQNAKSKSNNPFMRKQSGHGSKSVSIVVHKSGKSKTRHSKKSGSKLPKTVHSKSNTRDVSHTYAAQQGSLTPSPQRRSHKLKSKASTVSRPKTTRGRRTNTVDDEEYAIETEDGFIFVSKDTYESLRNLQ